MSSSSQSAGNQSLSGPDTANVFGDEHELQTPSSTQSSSSSSDPDAIHEIHLTPPPQALHLNHRESAWATTWELTPWERPQPSSKQGVHTAGTEVSKLKALRQLWSDRKSKDSQTNTDQHTTRQQDAEKTCQTSNPPQNTQHSPSHLMSFLRKHWHNLVRKYYQHGPPPLVLPTCPTDTEKYSYVSMNRTWLMSWGVFSCLSLGVGMWLFVIATPIWAWYGVFVVLANFYLSTSYLISCIGRGFSLEKHESILRSCPVAEGMEGAEARDTNAGSMPTVDVYLPVCGEPIEVLRNTWNHILRLRYPEERIKVFVLDDGASDEVRALALGYGFFYILRDDRPYLKKAGNLRYAYSRTTGDFFVVFDADFCPRPDFLLEVMPYHLHDPSYAIVQTPQYFRSVKEQTWVEQGAGSVQEFFYRVVQTTRDTWGASICVGSNAVYRRSALAAVGGTAEIAFSEDVHTGFHAVDRGWKVKYVPVVLACGVCPDTPRALFSQQMRWCRGSTTLLTQKSFYQSNLTWMQKFCYVTGFMYYSATALAVFFNPLPGPLLLWFRPDYFKYYNLFFAMPSILYGTFVMRVWARSQYTTCVQFTNTIMAYAYMNSIWDRFAGNALNWAASGDAKAHKNNKYRNMRLLCWVWTIAHNAALISAVVYRLRHGFPWYQVIPLLLLDAFNLYGTHRFLLFVER